MTARPVEVSLFPDHAPDKPRGPLLGSVVSGTNADLMVKIRDLYLTGSVLDVTYGEGAWWKRWKPADFTAHDLYKLDGVDFRHLPEADRSVDTVCFDPPYIASGGLETSTKPSFRDAFGLTDRPPDELWQMIRDGLAECARVASRWLLVKCGDSTDSAVLRFGHFIIRDTALTLGLGEPWDLIVHHTGSGPGGHNIFEPRRARRHHSYLLVWKI